MRFQSVVVAGLLVVSGAAPSTGQGLPVRNARPVVASVGSSAIYLDELARELGPAVDRARLQRGLGTAADLEMLERLITIKLVTQEADAMGLQDLPEIQKQVDVTSREILRELLVERLVKDIKPDPAAVERRFRESVIEWKTTSLIFRNEAAAKQAQADLANAVSFEDIAARALAAKTADRDGDDSYHGRKEYLPQVVEAIARLKVGQASPVLRLKIGFVVVKVLDIRYPENPGARAEARKHVLSQQQLAYMKAHEDELRRRDVVVNESLLKGIDYQAVKPGVAALLQDKRVVAEIKGAAPVTVGDLTDYLRMQFFHGSNEASQYRRMNEKKAEALDATLARRLLNMEARRLGIEKTTAYRDRVTGYRESLVFGKFVEKVIVPANRIAEDDVKRYYDAHLQDYSGPEMMRVRGLAFTQRASAEAAVKKLREGTDYGWLAANADGLAPAGAAGLLTFDGQPVMTSSMPVGLQKAVRGARAKEIRLYASPEGYYYALAIQQVIAPQPRPFAEVKDDAAKKVSGEKITKAVEGYAAKLRARTKVETYLKRTT